MVAIWGVQKHAHFSPLSHKHGHTLIIKSGRGLVSINGEQFEYNEGDVFDIQGSVPHGFVRVDEPTVVFEKRLKE